MSNLDYQVDDWLYDPAQLDRAVGPIVGNETVDEQPTGDTSLELESSRQFDSGPQTVQEYDIDRPVSRYVQPVMEYPSDKMVLRTFTVPANNPNGPTLLVNRQVPSVAARVRIRNVSAANPVYILTDNEQQTPSAVATTVYPTGFLLAFGQELALTTRSALWAIVPGAAGTGDAIVSVIVETYICSKES